MIYVKCFLTQDIYHRTCHSVWVICAKQLIHLCSIPYLMRWSSSIRLHMIVHILAQRLSIAECLLRCCSITKWFKEIILFAGRHLGKKSVPYIWYYRMVLHKKSQKGRRINIKAIHLSCFCVKIYKNAVKSAYDKQTIAKREEIVPKKTGYL